jgi:hypothetical protein
MSFKKVFILVSGMFVLISTQGIALGKTYYCQMNESAKTILEKKFTFKISQEIIRFLPEGHLAPGVITYMNENGPYFLAYIKYPLKGTLGEIEFFPGNSFDKKIGYLNYSDPELSFSALCSKF